MLDNNEKQVSAFGYVSQIPIFLLSLLLLFSLGSEMPLCEEILSGKKVSNSSGSTSKSTDEHIIQPGDTLKIIIKKSRKLSEVIKVNSEGKISYGKHKDILVSGMTLPQVDEKLTALIFSDYLSVSLQTSKPTAETKLSNKKSAKIKSKEETKDLFETHYALAQKLYKEKKYLEASYEFKKALELKPEHFRSKRGLKKCEDKIKADIDKKTSQSNPGEKVSKARGKKQEPESAKSVKQTTTEEKQSLNFEDILKSIRKSPLQKRPAEIPDYFDNPEAYCIGPEDVLEINIYDEPDLTRTVRINPDGTFSYPLLGRIEVAGLTVSQIENKITELLNDDYLVNPQVSVFVKQYRSRKVFILGCVKKSGEYDLKGEKVITVVQAISMAGGFTKVASPDKTRIIRIEDGKKKVIQIKISDITHKGDKSKDVILKPMDIVFVPESFF